MDSKQINQEFEQIANELIKKGLEYQIFEYIPDKVKLDFVEDWKAGEFD